MGSTAFYCSFFLYSLAFIGFKDELFCHSYSGTSITSSHHIHIYYLLKIVRKSMANDFEYPKALLKLKEFFYLTTKTDKVVCNRVLRDKNANMRINFV